MEAIAGKTIETAGRYGGDIFLAVLVILISAGFLTLYFFKVVIPDRASSREMAEKLTASIATMSTVTTDTHIKVDGVGHLASRMHNDLRVLVRTKAAEIRAIERVAQRAGVDVAAELNEIKGVLAMLERDSWQPS